MYVFHGRYIPDLFDRAHVTEWNQYALHELARSPSVGFVLFMTCTAGHENHVRVHMANIMIGPTSETILFDYTCQIDLNYGPFELKQMLKLYGTCKKVLRWIMFCPMYEILILYGLCICGPNAQPSHRPSRRSLYRPTKV